MNHKLPVTISCFLLLSGCASVIEGRAQEVTIQTDPAGASCTVMRDGTPLGTISPTPGMIYIEKTKDDISIRCSKSGYVDKTYINQSGHPKNSWLYILVGGPIGWGVDSASGADNQYTSPVTIDLSKK